VLTTSCLEVGLASCRGFVAWIGLDSLSAVVISDIGGVLAALKRCLAQGLPVRADTWTSEEEHSVPFGAPRRPSGEDQRIGGTADE
jgi:hypothetical protein